MCPSMAIRDRKRLYQSRRGLPEDRRVHSQGVTQACEWDLDPQQQVSGMKTWIPVGGSNWMEGVEIARVYAASRLSVTAVCSLSQVGETAHCKAGE